MWNPKSLIDWQNRQDGIVLKWCFKCHSRNWHWVDRYSILGLNLVFFNHYQCFTCGSDNTKFPGT